MMKRIGEITAFLKNAPLEELEALLEEYRPDEREGVQKLLAKEQKRLDAWRAEKARIHELGRFEREYADYAFICGIDEVGRGPFAGPVVAGAVILPKDCEILYINDSKKLSEKKREELYEVICEQAVSYAVGHASPRRIDEINILQATYEAMREAVSKLSPQPDLLLNDAVTIPGIAVRQVPIIKGDAKSISIGAASILAKVTRDREMKAYAEKYPAYGFDRNVGYGTQEHLEALKAYGPCPIHRASFIHAHVTPEDLEKLRKMQEQEA